MKEFTLESSADHKQHIGFSQYAYNILKSDYLIFNPEGKPNSWNSFLNKIIESYQDLHLYPADISHHFNAMYDDYCQSIKDIDDLTPQQRMQIKVRFEDAYIKTVKSNLKVFSSDKLSKTFNLNDAVTLRLADLEESLESIIFVRPGKYLAAIFESYAREPFLDREKIILNENFAKIEKAIKKNKVIRITHINGNAYKLIPYTLRPDKMGTYWYLAGVILDPEGQRYYSSFRLSRILQVREFPGESYILESEEKKELEQMIFEKGIQFLVSKSMRAVIRLTSNGQKKYANQLHRRPHISSELSDDTFEFISTKEQLEYYFFSFGTDAEIVEPQELRDIFIQKYKAALDIYN